MIRSLRVGLLLSSLLLVGLSVGPAVPFGAAEAAEVIEQIVVKVNGEIFTKTQLETRQVAALRELGRDSAPSDDDELRRLLDEVTPGVLVNVVDEMLIVQRGRDLGYRLTDDQFESVLENIKKENQIETDEQFKAALAQENMAMADLRKNLERSMIAQRVQQNEVLGKVGVTDEESRRYYEQHLAEFTTTQSVTLREVFINVASDGKTLNVGLDEEAREKAEKIRQRVLAGESFEKLAADLSDAPSRANAGLIGPLDVRDLSTEVRKLVESMKVGEVTEVLRGPRGYQLLKLETKTEPETQSYEQAKQDIANRVFAEKRRAEFEKYLQRLRAEAIIEWKNPEVRKAYEAGLARLKAQAQGASL
jgi:peptidyl-prolyl cis-trans isomerase SurA